MKVARLALAALAATCAISISACTQDEGWIITSFQSDISIATDSLLTVTEDINVDFGSQLKHGIFRTIPLRYRFDDTHDRFFTLLVQSVTDGTRPLTYDDYVDNNDNQVIKIGDPQIQLSGEQRYVITYKVEGAMNSFSDHDELFWNVDGSLWPASKSKVGATVHLPSAAIQKVACYQGAPGSTETCTKAGAGNTAMFESTRRFAPGEEMSVVTALTKGAVTVPPPMLEGRVRHFPDGAFDTTPLTIGVSLLVLVGGIALVGWNWWLHGRDREYLAQYYLNKDPREHAEPIGSHQPVVVEFGPPGDMRPAQLGVILDQSADTKDVSSTIVDLAVRGCLTISEVPGKKDWMLTWKGCDPSKLLPYENTIFDGLFSGRHEVTISELKGTFAPELRTAESQLYTDALERKLFTARPDQARAAWGCLGVAVGLAGAAATFFLGVQFGWGLIGAAVVVVGIVLTATFPFMAQRTAAGRDLLQHTLGFRLYMTTAEKYRQQFAEKAEIFTQLLPYAIVFGCVSLWAKAFEGIDTSAASTWYAGPGPFQAALLSSNLESMNSSISSAISYSPPSSGSSSGFGGGGSSGGGGGGGGGGSW